MDTTQHGHTHTRQVAVWDPVIRVFHWTLVALFLFTYVSGEQGYARHEWGGYTVLALVALRILWGFIGTRHARFRDFVHRPAAIIGYARDLLRHRARRYLGHNPLGGAMIVAMLATLIATGTVGLTLQQTREGGGALASAAPYTPLPRCRSPRPAPTTTTTETTRSTNGWKSCTNRSRISCSSWCLPISPGWR